MKKLITALCLAAICIGAAAQDSQAALKSLLEDNRVSFKYHLSAPAAKFKFVKEGDAVVDGKCYRIYGNELDIRCDGVSKWTIDEASLEVYIESSEGAAEFLANPAAYFELISELKYDGKTVSGIFHDQSQGADLYFRLDNIVSEPLTGSAEGFTLDTASLGPEWVITDLR